MAYMTQDMISLRVSVITVTAKTYHSSKSLAKSKVCVCVRVLHTSYGYSPFSSADDLTRRELAENKAMYAST